MPHQPIPSNSRSLPSLLSSIRRRIAARILQEAKQRLLRGGSAVLAVEDGDKLERHDEQKRREHERAERLNELQTVGASSFEQRWAGRSRKEAMELTLPHSVFSTGSSLELMWSARGGRGNGGAEEREAGLLGMAAVGVALALVTALLVILRLRRPRAGAGAEARAVL
jgi:hypothetical protein